MALIRCYAELNDLLSEERRYTSFRLKIQTPLPAEDVARSIGIPPDRIDLILLNGASVELSAPVSDDDRVAFYPIFESFDITSITRVREKPLREPRFVLDVHLGKLAGHLRMLGFDSVYRNDLHDDELERIAVEEGRTLLSKDRELLRRERVTRGYLVKHADPRQQLIEVLRRFDLASSTRLFTRCFECNAVLQQVEKSLIVERLPEKVCQLFDEFQMCTMCDRIYWKGSHFQRMQQFVDGVIRDLSTVDE